MTAKTELPDEFIMRIPAKSGGQPWSNYILVQKMIAAANAPPMLVPTLASVGTILTVPAEEPTVDQMFWGTFPLSGPSGEVYRKRIYIIPSFRLKKSDGTLLKVFTMAAQQQIIGTYLKSNFTPVVGEVPDPASGVHTPSYSSAVGNGPAAAATVPTAAATAAATATAASASTITHVESTPPLPVLQKQLEKKLHKAQKALKALTGSPSYHSSSKTAHRGLAPFVATQLLQLAILRHEMCPIVAEEFSAGNCGVMPCGHLFAKMAIEESFKKEPSKCPACRQTGVPTFV